MSRAWVIVLAGVSLTLGGLFRVWVHQDAVRLGYALTTEETHRAQLAEQLRKLDVELAAELMPRRLMRMAKARGLAPPTPSQILTPAPVVPRAVPRALGMARARGRHSDRH